MIQVSLEDIKFLENETSDLWFVQGEEIGYENQSISFKSWYDSYEKGFIFPFSFRRKGILLGYAIFATSTNLLEGFVYATNLTLYVKPEYRGGRTVLEAIPQIEEYFRDMGGVEQIIIQMDHTRPQYKLMDRLGYDKPLTTLQYRKEL